jgi:hypothetical protein
VVLFLPTSYNHFIPSGFSIATINPSPNPYKMSHWGGAGVGLKMLYYATPIVYLYVFQKSLLYIDLFTNN